MRLKVNALLPCVTYFVAGRFAMGIGSVAMQASLFLWPVTYRMAREFSDKQAVDRMLDELSVAYKLPLHATAVRKYFHPAVGFVGYVPAGKRMPRAA